MMSSKSPGKSIGSCLRAFAELFAGQLMDWTAVLAEWKPFSNEVRAHWSKLTSSQLDAIAGVRIRLAEQIRVSYGVTPDEAERQIRSFEARNQYLRAVSSR
jgi:hypothetical protein